MVNAGAVNRLVPFAHVDDVAASLDFYALLGFAPESVLKDPQARPFWARARSGTAEIMFARASGPVDPGVQAVLFYLYSPDVPTLRAHLLDHGVRDGGAFCGAPGPGDGRRVVFGVTYPHYMPRGEIRIADPDGYVTRGTTAIAAAGRRACWKQAGHDHCCAVVMPGCESRAWRLRAPSSA